MTHKMKLIRGKSFTAFNNREKSNEVMTEGEITFSSFVVLVEFIPSFQKRIQLYSSVRVESTVKHHLVFFLGCISLEKESVSLL